ncbi:hypothetical protein V5799_004418, partial [Amblyomma americanum]
PEKTVGVIQSLHLKNFMCHSKLDLKLSENTNFIIGRNGSGKSAILASIIIGLGGRATASSRGRNVKNIIQEGKRSAEVTLKLRNVGYYAYKPSEYGDCIIVTRKVSADGSSQYKIKSSSGAVVSCKRDELMRIVTRFNIQVDNPAMVLNQETSRDFLNTKNPKDRYRFFMKATLLELLRTAYNELEAESAAMQRDLAQKEKVLPEMEQVVKRWEKRWRLFQNLDVHRAKLRRLKAEEAWVKVDNQEEVFRQKEDECKKENDTVSKLKEKIAAADAKIDEHKTHQEKLQGELKEALERVEKVQPTLTAGQREYAAKKEQIREKEQEITRTEREVAEKRNKVHRLSTRIAELNSIDQNKQAEEKACREARVKELEKQRNELRSRVRTAEHHWAQVNASTMESSMKLKEICREENELRNQKTAISAAIKNLQSSSQSSLQHFGRSIPQLVREIDKVASQGGFRKRPKGPLGSLIKLKDQRWDLATECCLKYLLRAFLVDNDQDGKTLRQIMSRVFVRGERKPAIITSPYLGRVYDYRSKAMYSSRYISLLDNLVIEDADVVNCIIDQRSVERIVLIEANAEARDVMSNPATIPRNCREAFTRQGDQVYRAPDFRYYSAVRRRAEVLKESMGARIQERKAEMVSVDQKLQELDAKHASRQQELQQAQAEQRRLDAQLKSLRQQEFDLAGQIRELQAVEDHEPTNIAVLESTLKEFKDDIGNFEKKLATLTEQQAELRAEVKASAAKLRELDAHRSSLLKVSNNLKAKLIEADMELHKVKTHKRSLTEQKENVEKRQSVVESDLKAIGQQVEELTQAASEIAPERVSSRRKLEVIAAEIQKVESQLAVDENSAGTEEEVTKKYEAAKSKYKEAKDHLNDLHIFLRKLQHSVRVRKFKYEEFLDRMVFRLRVLFVTMLVQQNFEGTVEFDHEKERLHIM